MGDVDDAVAVDDRLLPLVFCPFAGIIYYTILLSAFLQSMRFVVGDPSGTHGWIPTSEIAWDTHWIYRLIAELGSIGGSTFIAAGIARERGRIGGSLGGLGIGSLVGFFAYCIHVLDLSQPFDEPWYQNYITLIVPVVSPFVGYYIGNLAQEISTSKPSGLAGIPRLHFFWLWFPIWFYALLLISPLLKFAYAMAFEPVSFFEHVLSLGVLFIFGFPAFLGFGLLAGDIKPEWKSLFRQLAGSGVLIGGMAMFSIFFFIVASLSGL